MVPVPTRVETERREPALDLLHFGERRRALASGETLHEGSLAADAVGEMNDGERIGKGRVERIDRGEVASEQEGRPPPSRAG